MKLELRRLRLLLVDGFLLEAIFSLCCWSSSFSPIVSQSLSLTADHVITVNQTILSTSNGSLVLFTDGLSVTSFAPPDAPPQEIAPQGAVRRGAGQAQLMSSLLKSREQEQLASQMAGTKHYQMSHG